MRSSSWHLNRKNLLGSIKCEQPFIDNIAAYENFVPLDGHYRVIVEIEAQEAEVGNVDISLFS